MRPLLWHLCVLACIVALLLPLSAAMALKHKNVFRAEHALGRAERRALSRRLRAPTGLDQSYADKERGVHLYSPTRGECLRRFPGGLQRFLRACKHSANSKDFRSNTWARNGVQIRAASGLGRAAATV